MKPTNAEMRTFGCCTWNKLGHFLWNHFQPLMGWCVSHRCLWLWKILKCRQPVVNATYYGGDGVSQVWCKKHTPAYHKNWKGEWLTIMSLE